MYNKEEESLSRKYPYQWYIFMFGFIPVIITVAVILGAYFYGKAVNSYLGIHVGIHKDIKTL